MQNSEYILETDLYGLKDMKNILFSATRQWNCGDEFILFGTQNLLENVFSNKINPILYDRNPDLLEKGNKKIWSNSWKHDSLSNIDFVVMAGSPEWMGNAVEPLLKKCKEEQKPVYYFGIGLVSDTVILTPLDIYILKKSPIITREFLTYTALKKHNINSTIMPCPALFSSKTNKSIEKINKIGLVWQNHKVESQKIGENFYSKIIKEFHKIEERYETESVCHYIDEFLLNKFKNPNYSYDAKDYYNIYNKFDLTISTRLHGAIFSISLGIPTILLVENIEKEDRLTSAAKEIPEIILSNADNLINVIENIDIQEINSKIIKYKKEKFNEYSKLISNIFKASIKHL